MSRSQIEVLKEKKREIITKYSTRSNLIAAFQTLTTLIPAILFLYGTTWLVQNSYYLYASLSFAFSVFFLLRLFVLMHDCGHNCLYDHKKSNKAVGFLLGVICGVPQYVWSKHHAYHHATNGNWNKYRGALDILSVTEFNNLSTDKQNAYIKQRRIILAPLAGFIYFFYNPLVTWVKGNIALFKHIFFDRNEKKIKDKLQSFEPRYWADWTEYRHMTAKNLVQIFAVTFISWYLGSALIVGVYIVALSLAGALGLILFTVQHNFEGSHATCDEGWDYDTAAILGTSYLDLPKVLHWFTADIGYHHVHHLSSSIPNYRLRQCHHEYDYLFESVKRITFKEVLHSTKYILWDESKEDLISMKEYQERYG